MYGIYNLTADEARLKGKKPVLRDLATLYRYGITAPSGIDANWRAWRLRVTHLWSGLCIAISATYDHG